MRFPATRRSTMKGLIVGALVGWYATRVHSLAKGLLVGLIVGYATQTFGRPRAGSRA
jgi:hypothetical protein